MSFDYDQSIDCRNLYLKKFVKVSLYPKKQQQKKKKKEKEKGVICKKCLNIKYSLSGDLS